ncbi:hypothetical protein BZA70DRAFT_282577 [Myxozyma melibiosi]|uniref:DNA endonuclease activator Ctp1 C-terminal domain-containing protein n=1 Tax=Myxozyma melibiosi TaxID=54550 RepID=A0ABR1F0Y3_9ASCO
METTPTKQPDRTRSSSSSSTPPPVNKRDASPLDQNQNKSQSQHQQPGKDSLRANVDFYAARMQDSIRHERARFDNLEVLWTEQKKDLETEVQHWRQRAQDLEKTWKPNTLDSSSSLPPSEADAEQDKRLIKHLQQELARYKALAAAKSDTTAAELPPSSPLQSAPSQTSHHTADQNDITAKEDELDDLKAEATRLATENAALKRTLDSYISRRSKDESAIEKWQQTLEKRQSRIAELKSQVSELTKVNESLQREREEVQSKKDGDGQKRVEELQAAVKVEEERLRSAQESERTVASRIKTLQRHLEATHSFSATASKAISTAGASTGTEAVDELVNQLVAANAGMSDRLLKLLDQRSRDSEAISRWRVSMDSIRAELEHMKGKAEQLEARACAAEKRVAELEQGKKKMKSRAPMTPISAVAPRVQQLRSSINSPLSPSTSVDIPPKVKPDPDAPTPSNSSEHKEIYIKPEPTTNPATSAQPQAAPAEFTLAAAAAAAAIVLQASPSPTFSPSSSPLGRHTSGAREGLKSNANLQMTRAGEKASNSSRTPLQDKSELANHTGQTGPHSTLYNLLEKNTKKRQKPHDDDNPPNALGKRMKTSIDDSVQDQKGERSPLISEDVARQNKGQARYSTSIAKPPGKREWILEDFIVNPSYANQHGIPHAFHEVTRNREERACLHGTDCARCKDFYAAAGPHVGLPSGPRWNDKSPAAGVAVASPSVTAREKSLIDKVSRHKSNWEEPPSPPGFWRSDFPNTQEAAEDRAEARRRNREKVGERLEEALRNGRFLFKDPALRPVE